MGCEVFAWPGRKNDWALDFENSAPRIWPESLRGCPGEGGRGEVNLPPEEGSKHSDQGSTDLHTFQEIHLGPFI